MSGEKSQEDSFKETLRDVINMTTPKSNPEENPFQYFATRSDLARVEGEISTLKEGQENLNRNQQALGNSFERFASEMRSSVQSLGEKTASTGMIKPTTAVAVVSILWAVVAFGVGYAMSQSKVSSINQRDTYWISQIQEREHDTIKLHIDTADTRLSGEIKENEKTIHELELVVDGINASRFTNERGVIVEQRVASNEATIKALGDKLDLALKGYSPPEKRAD